MRPVRSAGPTARNGVRELMRRFLDGGEDATRLRWDSFTTANGLPHNWIYDLFADSTGRMWVGTWGGGLAMYESGRWRIYDRRDGLQSDAVTCVREDGRGRIWAATNAGLNRLEGDRFVPAGLTGTSLLNIHLDRTGRLWAAGWRAGRTGGGLHRLEDGQWYPYSTRDGLPSLDILTVFEDSRDRIWIGTYEHGRGAGVGCLDGSTWHRFTHRDGLASDCVYSILEDPEGRMWFGTLAGISVYDRGTWHRMSTMDGLVHDRVYAMLIDSDQKMWFGTEGGVSRFDGTIWDSYTSENGLVDDLVRTIAQDRTGALWFGSYPYAPGAGGISRAIGPDIQRHLREADPRVIERESPSIGFRGVKDARP